jgi:hypothetical protein
LHLPKILLPCTSEPSLTTKTKTKTSLTKTKTFLLNKTDMIKSKTKPIGPCPRASRRQI